MMRGATSFRVRGWMERLITGSAITTRRPGLGQSATAHSVFEPSSIRITRLRVSAARSISALVIRLPGEQLCDLIEARDHHIEHGIVLNADR